MLGVFVILAGIMGLLGAFEVLNFKVVAVAASSLLVLGGLQTLMRGKCNCCNAA